MRLRAKASHFKVLPETGTPRSLRLCVFAFLFWGFLILLGGLLAYRLGYGLLHLRLWGEVILPGYPIHTERSAVLMALKVREGERVVPGQVVARLAEVSAGAELVEARLLRLARAAKLARQKRWRALGKDPELAPLLPEEFFRWEGQRRSRRDSRLLELAPLQPSSTWWQGLLVARLEGEYRKSAAELQRLEGASLLLAPHGGMVARIFKSAGEEVRPGEVVMRIHTGGCSVQAIADRRRLSLVRKIQRVKILLPDGTQTSAIIQDTEGLNAPFTDRSFRERYFSADHQWGWRLRIQPDDPSFPCALYDREKVEIEIPRWSLLIRNW